MIMFLSQEWYFQADSYVDFQNYYRCFKVHTCFQVKHHVSKWILLPSYVSKLTSTHDLDFFPLKPSKLVQLSVEQIQWSVQMIHFPKLKMSLVSSLSSVDQIQSFLMVFSSPSMVGLSVNNFIFNKKYFGRRILSNDAHHKQSVHAKEVDSDTA